MEHDFEVNWHELDPSQLKRGALIRLHGRIVQVEAVRKVDGEYEITFVDPLTENTNKE